MKDNYRKFVTRAVKLLRQLGIAEEALSIAAKFNPAPATRAEDSKRFRDQMQKALDEMHKIDTE